MAAAMSTILSSRLGWSLFGVGFSLLTYEMALTRVCSALFSYHFSFLAVSLALLGLGLGGLWLVFRPCSDLGRTDPWFAGMAVGILAFTLVSFLVPFEATSSLVGVLPLLGLMLLGCLPFFCCGVIVCSFLAVYRDQAGRVYAFDLAGGALACLTVNLLLDTAGPVITLLLSALICALAGMAVWRASQREKSARISASALSCIAVSAIALAQLVSGGAIAMDTVSLGLDTPRQRISFDAWNCLSRISVIVHNPKRAQFVIDAGADTWVASPDSLYYYPSELAFAMREGGRYSVIGPGAGPDVAMGSSHHPSQFDLVEINPIMVSLVKGAFKQMSGGLYDRPEIRVHIADGRSFMDRTSLQFDVLVISLVDTYASVSGGAYALTENYVYTADSMASYLDRVAPEGILAVSRWAFETPRLVGMVRKALEKRGVKRPQDHMFAVMSRNNTVITLLVNPRPWTASELVQLRSLSEERKLPVALQPDTDLSLNVLAAAASLPNYDDLNKVCPLELSVVTDDRPFFLFWWKPANKVEPGPLGDLKLPWNGGRLADMGREHTTQHARVMLLLLIPVVLGLASSAVVALGAVRGIAGTRVGPGGLLYFCLLGWGFMLFEISLAQRLVLLSGHPAYAISIVLFSFLVCGALGSHLSQKVSMERLRSAQIACGLGIATLTCLAAGLYPLYVVHFLGSSQVTRSLACFLWIAPVATLSGMPFPMGLRLIAADKVPWIWALNGSASVTGSALAVALGLALGFDCTTYVGGACYLLVAVLAGARLLPQGEAQ
jgi:hypothetical protein